MWYAVLMMYPTRDNACGGQRDFSVAGRITGCKPGAVWTQKFGVTSYEFCIQLAERNGIQQSLVL